MSEKILVPVLGESINEATVSKWLKKEGDAVEADEPIVELESDLSLSNTFVLRVFIKELNIFILYVDLH